MSGQAWSIDPAGVEQVLTGMQPSLDGTAAAIDAVRSGVTDVAGGAGDVVNEALGAFVEKIGGDIDQIELRLVGGVQGVRGAVDAYRHGDLEMAATMQRAGAHAYEKGDLSVFLAADTGGDR
jgi:hypothetical protein